MSLSVVPLPPRCNHKTESPTMAWICIASPHPHSPDRHQFVRLGDDGYPVRPGSRRG